VHQFCDHYFGLIFSMLITIGYRITVIRIWNFDVDGSIAIHGSRTI